MCYSLCGVNDMTIGECIRDARKAAGLTQNELADKSGVAAISIHQYEKGKRQPRLEQLLAIARALDIDLDSLIPAEDDTPGRSKEDPASDLAVLDYIMAKFGYRLLRKAGEYYLQSQNHTYHLQEDELRDLYYDAFLHVEQLCKELEKQKSAPGGWSGGE